MLSLQSPIKTCSKRTLKEVNGVDHFFFFFLKNYIHCIASLQSMMDPREYAKSLEQRTLEIGKIFIIRWVEFSFKTVHRIWNNFSDLHKNFLETSLDNTRETQKKDQSIEV